MLRPNVFAVFRLITKLNLVACITGKSLGALLEAYPAGMRQLLRQCRIRFRIKRACFRLQARWQTAAAFGKAASGRQRMEAGGAATDGKRRLSGGAIIAAIKASGIEY